MANDNNFSDCAGFKVTREIGRGGFGTVYELAGTEAGKKKALKILRPTPFLPKNHIEMIVKAAVEVSKICENLNVVKIEDSGCRDSVYFIIMPYYEQGSMEKYLACAAPDINMCVGLLKSISQTLAEVHSCGLVHGDIKPSNFLIADDGIPLITDFYYVARDESSSKMPQGTPEFMSPEQARGRYFGFSSDIYSLGVMMYIMFTGRSPFCDSSNLSNLINDKLNGHFPGPQKVNARVSDGLNDTIMKAMMTRPEDRYPSMMDFHNAISRISSQENNQNCFFQKIWNKLFRKPNVK
jgi:serine/threonine-protein kinase